MDTETRLFLLIAEQIINKNKNEEINNLLDKDRIDWSSFKELLLYHELSTFAYPVLKDFARSLPLDFMEFLKNNYYCAAVRCQAIWQEFLRIAELFAEKGLSIVPIKGVALLTDIYLEKSIRPMTDIDLLVKEDDFEQAEDIFMELGYRKELYGLKEEYWRKKQTHIAFYNNTDKNLPFVELHWALDFKKKNRSILPRLWERIREVEVGDSKVKLLSIEDTLFCLALHSRRYGRTLCLKNVFDLALILNKYPNFEWDYVLAEAASGKMRTPVFFILAQLELLFKNMLPGDIEKELNIPAWKRKIIRYFIQRNSFSLGADNLYLKSHFLLYDSFWEPIEYIINIPQEQFAKYYGLSPYDRRTDSLYNHRLFYMPLKALHRLL